ncbi:hypothetical protein EMA8858_00032 [Emticicia aquatica]|uniref:GLPGLI family protein n=1 Tax=Emticicia aquatica TaxID=1681835 RepID=A0ABN8EM47_9BACT|nr:hypothetical protein [Emticicia aquatica]CAH0993927.1 hypothetical protein EMA8858_00032 [Emticicia aquatica]
MKPFLVSILFIIFIGKTHRTVAQTSVSNSVFYQKAIDNSVALYHQKMGEQSGLYNGSQYPTYQFVFQENGHPYFNKNTFCKGSIVYENVLYPNVKLLYDEVAEVIIFQDSSHFIQLINDKISQFTLENAFFIRIQKDSLNNLTSGFYQVLYDGKVNVLKRETKTVNETLGSTVEGVLRYIKIERFFYIKNNNIYYPIRQKTDVFRVYKDYKKDIQKYLKNNSLNFKNDRDIFLVNVSNFHDQLTK